MTTFVIPTDTVMVEGPPQGQWTYADLELLEDDGNRYEIIDGYLYMTTAHSPKHQTALSLFVRYFAHPGEDKGYGTAFFSPIGVFMPGCDPVQPDICFVRAENADMVKDRGIEGVPCLIIEALSPRTARYDETVKLEAYQRCGVPEYGVMDIKKRSVRLYRLNADKHYDPPVELSGADTLTFACLPGITAPVEALFAGSPDTTI